MRKSTSMRRKRRLRKLKAYTNPILRLTKMSRNRSKSRIFKWKLMPRVKSSNETVNEIK